MVAILTLSNMFFFHDKIVKFMDAKEADDSPDENEIEVKAQSPEVQSHQSITDWGGLSFQRFSKQESPQVDVKHPMKDISSDKNTNLTSRNKTEVSKETIV